MCLCKYVTSLLNSVTFLNTKRKSKNCEQEDWLKFIFCFFPETWKFHEVVHLAIFKKLESNFCARSLF